MKCAHCKQDHSYAFQVRECSKKTSAATNHSAAMFRTNSERPPTANQLSYIADLAEKKGISGIQVATSFSQASKQIAWLKKQPFRKDTVKSGPIISYPVTNIIPDGRYAVKVDDEKEQWAFIRVSRPKTGAYKGKLVVQSQHSDQYVRRLVFDTATGRTDYQNNRIIFGERLADILSAIVVDQDRAAFDYAEQKGVCFNCGKSLTDHRSVYLGIGPECEKTHRSYVAWVEEQKGSYIGQ